MDVVHLSVVAFNCVSLANLAKLLYKGRIVIQINWKSLIKAQNIEVVLTDNPNRSKISIAPLERGFGYYLR